MLKGDRYIVRDEITNISATVGTRGTGWVYTASGSGQALGGLSNSVSIVANPSGYKFAGLALEDVVNIDQTRFHTNYMKDEVQIGQPINLLKDGWVVTNNTVDTIAVGDAIYLSSSGFFTKTLSASGGLVATPKVGRAESIKDENGYFKLVVIPNS